MAKIYDEMAASLLVSFLKTEIAAHDDEDAPDECGVYIPMRKTPIGNFTMPLYTKEAA